MFTCPLVRSHPDSRRRWGETWTVVLNSLTPGWAQQQDACSQGEVRMGLSLCPERGHEGRIREVPREDRCSSMYIDYYALLSCNCIYSHCYPLALLSSIWLSMLANSCMFKIWFITLTGVYFSQVKINHDIHEFILDTGSVANNTVYNFLLFILKITHVRKL